MTRRSWLVYGILLAIWMVLIAWQGAEHARTRIAARAGLRHRAEDISDTLALIMRSGRGPFASKERIESWLNDLVKQREVRAIKLFNIEGDELVSAGDPVDLPKDQLSGKEYWDEKTKTVTLMNLVDLGTNIIQEFRNRSTNSLPNTNGSPTTASNLAPAQVAVTNGATSQLFASNNFAGTNNGEGTNEFRRPPPRRPRYTPEEIQALREKKSAHGFIMVMSAESVYAAMARDLWLRAFIAMLGTVAVLGCGVAWRNLAKTSELQIRLVRASELNSHLNQMNLAAAGLAHETRNPLNIVRGLAQMISKQDDTPPEIRIKAREIIDETDRVAAQLNEFINYSRPREVRAAPTRLNSVVSEVTRALNYDIEEKKVQIKNNSEELVVDADEQMLRQALFNLVLNAVQAVPQNGEISVRASKNGGAEAFIEVADNGPGVTQEHRADIFKPYFTTNEEGRGLGLAVVRQIVLAHGWEIECLPNTPTGACFRITHLKVANRS